jgi:uncharacterized protein YqeY
MTTDIQTTIRAQIIQAHKAGDVVAKEVLRVALGEIQLAEKGTATTDDDRAAAVKKVIKGINNTLENCGDRPDLVPNLKHEKETLEAVLKDFVPQTMSKEEIIQLLDGESFDAAMPEGKVMGLAMKKLKTAGKPIDPNLVKEVISVMRK